MDLIFFDYVPTAGMLLWFFLAVTFALSYQAVNGFHDTANAVATVVYTRSLKANPAVILSGICNLVGVLLSGVGVAYAIVNLLPVEVLVGQVNAQFAMVFAILTGALVWNLGTWYLGIPASSSHTLIGAVLGVGLTHAWITPGLRLSSGLRWSQVASVFKALLFSPLIGFGFSLVMLLLLKKFIRDPVLFQAPAGETPPPRLIRALIVGSCAGVSFAHGSNDGQKGMGLMMLILIGLVPYSFSLDMQASSAKIQRVVQATEEAVRVLRPQIEGNATTSGGHAADATDAAEVVENALEENNLRDHLAYVLADLEETLRSLRGVERFTQIPQAQRFLLRKHLLIGYRAVVQLRDNQALHFTPAETGQLEAYEKSVSDLIQYVSGWVKVSVAIALGLGTMIGWKRVAVTVGEKIGRQPLTYAQGLSAQCVAMLTIIGGDVLGLPVSTTHVLASGVAGSMVANRSGLQRKTLLNIGLAWVLTLPASMALASGAYLLLRQL